MAHPHNKKCPGFYIMGTSTRETIFGVCSKCGAALEAYSKKSKSCHEDRNKMNELGEIAMPALLHPVN